MIKTVYIWLACLFCSITVLGQNNIERKIIIENGYFNFITVDENIQLATLYRGKRADALAEAKAYALPAGRNTSAQTNPFAWDLEKEQMVAVSFLDHPLNDRNEAIKKIQLSDLKEWSSAVTIDDMIMQSVDKNMLCVNQPYLFWQNRTKYYNHFYFDGVLEGTNYWMVSANNGELVIWKYAKQQWEQSELVDFPVQNYFAIVELKGSIYLIDDGGAFYNVSLTGLKKSPLHLNDKLSNVILIEDRDNDKLYCVGSEQIDLKKTTDELIVAVATQLKN